MTDDAPTTDAEWHQGEGQEDVADSLEAVAQAIEDGEAP